MSGFSDGDGAWDEDENYGVLSDDSEDIWGGKAIDQSNPLITAKQDREAHSPPVKVVKSGAMAKPPVALVAVFDEQSRPMVARTIIENGRPKQLEDYRVPTEDEFNAVMFGKNAKLVRGGVVGTEVPAGTNLPATMQKTPLGIIDGVTIDWRKLALYGGVGVVAIGGGWWGYKKLKERKKGKAKK